MKSELEIQKMEQPQKTKKENSMREIYIEKVLLSAGGTDLDLDKAVKLLKVISEMEPQIIASSKRIPDFKVRPGLKVGTRVTVRGEKAIELLKRLLGAVGNMISEESIADNHFSFGIKEYIEIPEMKFHRDIGIRGLNVTVVFSRPGARVKRRKKKPGKIPEKQEIKKDEIINYMEENFETDIE